MLRRGLVLELPPRQHRPFRPRLLARQALMCEQLVQLGLYGPHDLHPKVIQRLPFMHYVAFVDRKLSGPWGKIAGMGSTGFGCCTHAVTALSLTRSLAGECG